MSSSLSDVRSLLQYGMYSRIAGTGCCSLFCAPWHLPATNICTRDAFHQTVESTRVLPHESCRAEIRCLLFQPTLRILIHVLTSHVEDMPQDLFVDSNKSIQSTALGAYDDCLIFEIHVDIQLHGGTQLLQTLGIQTLVYRWQPPNIRDQIHIVNHS